MALQSTVPCLSATGVFLDAIRDCAKNFEYVRFDFTPRLGNTLVNALSRNFVVDENGGTVLPHDILLLL